SPCLIDELHHPGGHLRLAILDRRGNRDRERWIENGGDAVDEPLRTRLLKVRQNNDRKVVTEKAGILSLETLPRPSMLMQWLASALLDAPSESVRIGLAAVQPHRRQHLIPTLGSQDAPGADGRVPRNQIAQ